MKNGTSTRFFVIVVFLSVFCCFLLPEACPGDAESRMELFLKGNDYYEKGEYENAAGEYEKIIDEGYAGGAVYYNLAGAYFKEGQLGRAILNYERAKCFMPRSADLDANYKFARRKMKRTVSPRKEIWLLRPVRIYSDFFTVRELTWIISAMYLMILIVIAVTIIAPALRKYRLVPVILLITIILFTSFSLVVKLREMCSSAVVTIPETSALFGPFDTATKFFDLYEGMTVKVLKSKDDWYKVKRVDGKAGWVKNNEVQLVR